MTRLTKLATKLNLFAWLKAFAGRHKVITALVLLCAAWQGVVTPIKNPFASEAVTIRGRFPFDQGYELEFLQYVYNTTDWSLWMCAGFGYLNDRATCTDGREILHPKKIDGQHYELTVYKDRYFKGPMGWTASQDGYRAFQKSADQEKMLFLGLRPGGTAMVCDDAPEMMKRFQDELFCIPQGESKNYKTRLLPYRPIDHQAETFDFWLKRELDDLIQKKEGHHGLQPQ